MNIDNKICKGIVEDVENIFKENFQREFRNGEIDGDCALLIKPDGEIIETDRSFLKEDLKSISEYVINKEDKRIIGKIHGLVLSYHVFYFKRFHSLKEKENIVLAGFLINKNDDLDVMNVVLKSRRLASV